MPSHSKERLAIFGCGQLAGELGGGAERSSSILPDPDLKTERERVSNHCAIAAEPEHHGSPLSRRNRMYRTYKAIAIAAFFALLAITPLHAGGDKCPPRQGLITLAGPDIVFVDRADSKIYLLDLPEAALEHMGHTVTLVGHPSPLKPEMLVVHQISRQAR
jgi:hypothetical protein